MTTAAIPPGPEAPELQIKVDPPESQDGPKPDHRLAQTTNKLRPPRKHMRIVRFAGCNHRHDGHRQKGERMEYEDPLPKENIVRGIVTRPLWCDTCFTKEEDEINAMCNSSNKQICDAARRLIAADRDPSTAQKALQIRNQIFEWGGIAKGMVDYMRYRFSDGAIDKRIAIWARKQSDWEEAWGEAKKRYRETKDKTELETLLKESRWIHDRNGYLAGCDARRIEEKEMLNNRRQQNRIARERREAGEAVEGEYSGSDETVCR
ncbi:MAG: hypothetical protein M1819_002028 [Sarea resinae]|nr:MAG: hypothetical protein M1819_002028 [Sarea resinae]